MALIKCKGCGHMISDRANNCPQCGYPVRLSVKQQSEFVKQSESTQEVFNNDSPELQPNVNKKGFIVTIIAIVIIVCGFILYVVLHGRSASNDPQKDSTTVANTNVASQNRPIAAAPSDAEADNADHTIDESNITDDAWEEVVLYGSMTDENGENPIELSFEYNDNKLRNCVYTNVDLGGKIKMEGEIIGNEIIFTGKDGMNQFQIRIDAQTYNGMATDGPKTLYVSLQPKD